MAAAIEPDKLKSWCECPVCMDTFTDPRLLVCGHQFCEQCLQDIFDHHQYGELPCPTCREVTKPKLGDVKNLPRSTLHQYIQDLIFNQPKPVIGKTCGKCNNPKPTRHCPECKVEMAFLCDGCYAKHQKVPRLAKHETVPFDPLYVCSEHQSKMVECFCHTCKKVVCEECIFETHGDHRTETIEEAAAEARKNVKTALAHVSQNLIDVDCLKEFESTTANMQNARRTLQKQVENVKTACKTFENKLDEMLENFESVNNSSMLEVSTMTENARKSVNDQEQLMQIMKSLLKAPSPQLIIGSIALPQPAVEQYELETRDPEISDTLANIVHRIEEDMESLNDVVTYENTTLEINTKGIDAKYNQSIVFNSDTVVTCVAVDTLRGKIIVTSMSMKEGKAHIALKLYTALGGDEEIIDASEFANGFSCVTHDTKRDLYVLGCWDGTLITLDHSGTMKQSKKFERGIVDICYDKYSDQYLVMDIDGNLPGKIKKAISNIESDWSTDSSDDSDYGRCKTFAYMCDSENEESDSSGNDSSDDNYNGCDNDSDDDALEHVVLTIISAKNLKKVPTHKGKVMKLPLESTLVFCLLTCSDIDDDHNFAITDPLKNQIKVYSTDSLWRHSYGPYISDELMDLDGPSAAAVDDFGKMFINDTGNECILCCWNEDGKTKWKCILEAESLENDILSIAVATSTLTVYLYAVSRSEIKVYSM